MATVNKASLRSEFDAPRVRFESLCADGRMGAESRGLVEALLMLFELLMAVVHGGTHRRARATRRWPGGRPPRSGAARHAAPHADETGLRVARSNHRTVRHAEAHCRLSGYLQSMAGRGCNPLAAIQIALNGNAARMEQSATR